MHSSWNLFSTIDGCHAKTLHVCSLDDSNDGEFFLSETEFFAKKEEESQCSVKKAHNTNELLFFLFQKRVLINFDCSNMRFVVKMKSKKKKPNSTHNSVLGSLRIKRRFYTLQSLTCI